jgi:hypothetical protein
VSPFEPVKVIVSGDDPAGVTSLEKVGVTLFEQPDTAAANTIASIGIPAARRPFRRRRSTRPSPSGRPRAARMPDPPRGPSFEASVLDKSV